MRFSLFTLVLLSLWIGTAMLVWQRREPWVKTESQISLIEFERRYPGWIAILEQNPQFSPGRDRFITVMGRFFLIKNANPPGQELVRLYERYGIQAGGRFIFSGGFIDDNIVAYRMKSTPIEEILNPPATDVFTVFRRRYPEWWWGHFYRLEVWVLVGLTIGIGVRWVMNWRAKVSAPAG